LNDKTSRRFSVIVNVTYYFIIAALIYLCLRYVIGWMLPFVLAFIIVWAVRPVILWIKRKLRFKRDIVSFSIVLLLYVVVCTLLALLVTQLIFAIRDLFFTLPDYYEQTLRPTIMAVGSAFSEFVGELPEAWQLQLADMQGELLKNMQAALINLSQRGISSVSSFTTRVPSFLIALIFTIMLSFFISLQYDQLIAFIRGVIPQQADRFITKLRGILLDTVARYLRASLTLMMITAAELFVGLLLIGNSHALWIALGIAIFDALPFFGTGAIMIPWIVIELLQGNLSGAVPLAILYGIVTLVRNIIEPKIVSDKLGINPIVSLVSIYLGLKTMGVLGMIAMPILVQILLALHKAGMIVLYKERRDAPPQEEPIPPEGNDG